MTLAPSRSPSLLTPALVAAVIAGAAGVVELARTPPAHAAPGARPSWCDDFRYGTSTSYDASWFDDLDMPTMLETPKATEVFAEAVCATDWDNPGERKRIMAIRDTWMKAAGYDEADFAVVAGEARGYVEDEQDLSKVAGPVAQAAAVHGPSAIDRVDELGARASMLARFQMVRDCLLGMPAELEDQDLLRAILCTRETLDRGKALAEIDAAKGLGGRARKDLRQMVRKADDASRAIGAMVAARAADDPGVAKVVAIADAEVTTWASPDARRAKLIAGLEAMEAATASGKRSPFAGCEERTRAAWEEVLASSKLPKVPGEHVVDAFVSATLGTAEGYLAYEALRLCSASQEGELHRGTDIVTADLRRRGPRSGTLAAWAAAAGEIEFDTRGLEMKTLVAGALRAAMRGYEPTVAKGVIAAITPRDGFVEISFKKVTATVEDCVDWRETDRIARIQDNGTVEYKSECTRWGKVKVDLTARPLQVGAVLAHGLAPGMYLRAIEEGLPLVATASATSTKPVWVLGGAVR